MSSCGGAKSSWWIEKEGARFVRCVVSSDLPEQLGPLVVSFAKDTPAHPTPTRMTLFFIVMAGGGFVGVWVIDAEVV